MRVRQRIASTKRNARLRFFQEGKTGATHTTVPGRQIKLKIPPPYKGKEEFQMLILNAGLWMSVCLLLAFLNLRAVFDNLLLAWLLVALVASSLAASLSCFSTIVSGVSYLTFDGAEFVLLRKNLLGQELECRRWSRDELDSIELSSDRQRYYLVLNCRSSKKTLVLDLGAKKIHRRHALAFLRSISKLQGRVESKIVLR